jgi:hypothetical protein
LVAKGYSPEEAKKIMLEKLGQASGNIVAWSDTMTDQQRAVNAEMFTNVGKMTEFGRILKENNGNVGAAMAQIAAQQKTQGAGNAAALGQANQSIVNFGNGLTGMMNKVLGPVTTKLLGWSEMFMNEAGEIVKPDGPLSGILDSVIEMVKELLSKDKL